METKGSSVYFQPKIEAIPHDQLEACAYCFCVNNDLAVNVLKVEGGFATVEPEEIYAV